MRLLPPGHPALSLFIASSAWGGGGSTGSPLESRTIDELHPPPLFPPFFSATDEGKPLFPVGLLLFH